MARKKSIHLKWDRAGQISHSFSGISLFPPMEDSGLWVLSPSAPIFLTHQFGAMKPSYGLIACGRVIDIIFHNKYVIMPINSALKEAKLDFIYTGGPSIRFQFHPKHALFANSDSVEEGVRQLLNNYMRYVYSKADDYTRIVIKTITYAAINKYFEFLQDQNYQGRIGRGLDKWYPGFSQFSSQLVAMISAAYYVPEGGRTPQNEEWAREQTDFLDNHRIKLESIRDSIFTLMGIY